MSAKRFYLHVERCERCAVPAPVAYQISKEFKCTLTLTLVFRVCVVVYIMCEV